jgi:hypothetical protein
MNLFMASGLLGVLGMSDQEWERAGERLRYLLATGALLYPAQEVHHYSWVEGYIEWLEGKEAREQYYALLEEEFLPFKR